MLRFVLCVAVIGGARLASASTWFVDAAAPAGGDGLGWPSAFRFLQDALENGELLAGDEIWVAQGVYRPDQREANPDGTLDPGETFRMEFGVRIFGGFPAGGDITDRDPAVYITVLTGDFTAGAASGGHPACEESMESCFVPHGTPGCNQPLCCEAVCDIDDFCCTGEWDEFCVGHTEGLAECQLTFSAAYHVVTAQDVDGARLDGFTITGGSAEGLGMDSKGAGMLVSDASPDVVRCTFNANSADEGAGIAVAKSSFEAIASPYLVTCRFLGNSASGSGGGIHVLGGDLTLTNCLFSGNSSGASGGGMYTNGNGLLGITASAVLANCTLSQNTALVGGGLFNEGNQSVVSLANCVVWNNSTGQIGGSATQVTYSCVQDGFAGEGNIQSDPEFLDADGPNDTPGDADDDLRLAIDSLCNDAGTNGGVPADGADLDADGDQTEPTPLDLRFFQRFSFDADDSPVVCEPVVDMGAFENGDCDGDEVRDDAEPDTNSDGVPDDCQDCNGNGTLDPIDIAVGFSADCNVNGIPDECDVATGCSQDLNANGVPDECECALDVVYLIDTSGSIGGGEQTCEQEFGPICAMIDDVSSALTALPLVRVTTLANSVVLSAPCAEQSVAEATGVDDEPSQECPSMPLGAEDWASAIEIVVTYFDWLPGAVRVVVPIFDEGPCQGHDPCNEDDNESLDAAIDAARAFGCQVFAICGVCSVDCALDSGEDIAACTSGKHYIAVTQATYTEPGGIGDQLAADLEDAVFRCLCPCPWDTDGPAGLPDGAVGINDLLNLLAHWGPCTPCALQCSWDTDGPGGLPDGNVGINDLLDLLAHWGDCPCDPQIQVASIEEELADACLTTDDWDQFVDCMTNGTPGQQNNCLCWMRHFLENCNRCYCSHNSVCPGQNPF